VIGQAIPSYGPQYAGGYVKKLDCFCFKQQTFAPHEVREMPVVFLLEKGLPEDVNTVTLSYTFFEVPAGSTNSPATLRWKAGSDRCRCQIHKPPKGERFRTIRTVAWGLAGGARAQTARARYTSPVAAADSDHRAGFHAGFRTGAGKRGTLHQSSLIGRMIQANRAITTI
jgi:hypothetical protein